MDVNDLAILGGAWLLTYALHSTVLIGSAWLAALGLARLSCQRWASPRLRDALPELRERLWKVALVGGLATASVQTGLGLDPWGAKFLITRPVVEIASAPTVVPVPSTKDTRVHVPDGATTGDTLARDSAAVRAPVGLGAERIEAPTGPATHAQAKPAAPSPGPATSSPRLRPRLEPTQRAHLSSSSSSDAPIAAATLILPTPDAAPEPVARVPARALPGPSTFERRGAPAWCLVLIVLWAAGVLYAALRWIWRWNRLLRQIDERIPIVSGSVHEIFQDLRRRSSARRKVTLALTPGIGAPITLGSLGTLGLSNYTICLPPRVTTDLQADEIAALLAHELAHTERRDPFWLVLCSLIEVVFFFQPLNRICASWLQDESEYQCDDWAAVHIGERVPLASCLTEIAGWLVPQDRPRLASGMAARGTRLGLRVHRLLDEEHEPCASPRASWFSLAGASAAVCIGLLVPGFAAEGAASPSPTTQERLEQLEERFSALGGESAALPSRAAGSSTSGPGIARESVRAGDPSAKGGDAAAPTLSVTQEDAGDPRSAALGLVAEIDVLRADLDRLRDEMSARSVDALFLVRFAFLESSLQRLEATSRELELLLEEDAASRAPAVAP